MKQLSFFVKSTLVAMLGLGSVNSALAQWSVDTLLLARQGLAAAAAGGKVFFAGGSDSQNSPTDRVDVYDTLSRSWTTARLSQARQGLAAVSVGGKILFAGGSTAQGASSVADIYDLTTNTWTTSALPQVNGARSAAATNGKAFFAGASLASGIVDVYDVAANTWTTLTLPAKHSSVSVAASGSKVFFAGGYVTIPDVDGNPFLAEADVVDIYDVATNTWTTARLSQARVSGMATVSAGSKVFFAGGIYSSGRATSAVVDIYDAATNAWSTTQLSQAHRNFTGASVAGKVLFVGGIDPLHVTFPPPRTNVAEVYDLATARWTTDTLLTPNRFALAAASTGTTAFFGGGTPPGGNVSNWVDIYDTTVRPLVVVRQPAPASATVCQGVSVGSTVQAAGTTLTYQWYKGAASTTAGTLVAGQTTPTLTLPNPQPADAGAYYARVSGPGGAVWSSAFVLIVNPLPIPTVTPGGSVNLCMGSSVTLKTGTFSTYRWNQNGQPLAGATTSQYAIGAPVGFGNTTDTYSVTVRDANGCSATSAVTPVTVNATTLLQFLTPSQTVCAASPVLLSSSATGSNLTYQWYQGTPGGAAQPVAGGTERNLAVTPTQSASYFVAIRGACGTVVSQPVALTVRNELRLIGPSSACEGTKLTFTVRSSGSGPLVYQWKNPAGTVVSTDSSLTLASLQATDAGTYTATAQGSDCGPASLSVPVMVRFARITDQPKSADVCRDSITLNVGVQTVGVTPTYQWRKNGQVITGATSASYAVAASAPGTYSVVVSTPCGNLTSADAVVGCIAGLEVPSPAVVSLTVGPNPVVSREIRGQIRGMQNPGFRLVDAGGQRLPVWSAQPDGPGTFVLRPTQVLPAGLYLLEATDGKTRLTQRILLAD